MRWQRAMPPGRNTLFIDDTDSLDNMRVAIVGLGYVGLSTAVCLAKKFQVIGVDAVVTKVELIAKGTAPFMERGLSPLLKKHVRSKMLRPTTSYDGVRDADIVFVTVGTPSAPSGEVDLSQVRSVARSLSEIIRLSNKRVNVVLKSTVIPGTTRGIMKLIEEGSGKTCGDGFGLSSNPEFLREGQAIQDTLKPNRIVIGPLDSFSGRSLRAFYTKFYGKRMPPVVETSAEMAEMIKYASNAFLATKVSFINLMARVCERIPGGDVNDVACGMGLDPRIGSLFLRAGPGFGGSCFPKDVRALVSYVKRVGVDAHMLESVLEVNETQPISVVSQAEKMLGSLEGKSVAVLGLAFNPDTDDVRESRALPLIRKILQKGGAVRAYDPMAMQSAKNELDSSVTYSRTAKECIKDADLAIVMTAWEEFKDLRSSDFASNMRKARILDARRIYDPTSFSDVEFAGCGLGPPILQE